MDDVALTFSDSRMRQIVPRRTTMAACLASGDLTCPECLDELDRYTQSILDGMPIDGLLDRVREHLEACPCCTGQFELVLETLKAIEE